MLDTESRILVVVEDPSISVMLQQMLRRQGYENVRAFNDSSRLDEFCTSFEPNLLLLDLQVPGKHGFDVLGLLPQDKNSRLQVLVIASEKGGEYKRMALEGGAHDFVHKPLDEVELAHRVKKLLTSRKMELSVDEHERLLESRIIERTREITMANIEAVSILATAAEFRDEDVGEHIFRVGRTTGLIAERLGLEPILVGLYRTAATLHDVGKIAVPDSILLKPGKFDGAEREIMKTHTTQGHRIMKGSRSQVMVCAADIALSHHEHWDGGGYPNGIAGEDIFQSARIVSVADVFDALTSKRPYKEAWPIEDAMALLREKSGSQFDPEVVEAFLELDPGLLTSSINEKQFYAVLEPGSDRLDL